MKVPSQDRTRLIEVSLRLEELQLPSDQQYATPRSYGWLGDHQDEAAELAALLHEAAPKLALAGLSAPGTRTSRSGTPALPKARSYEISDSTKDRLRAAVPLPTGSGQVDWSRLSAVISSELLSFDEVADLLLAHSPSTSCTARGMPPAGAGMQARMAAAAAAGELAELAGPLSPGGGDRLEINSGGRVIFCLFEPDSRAPTPPSSLRNSPDKELSFIQRRAAQLEACFPQDCAEIDINNNGSSSSSSLVEGEELSLCLEAGGGPHAAGPAVQQYQQQLQQQQQQAAYLDGLDGNGRGGGSPGTMPPERPSSFSFPAPPLLADYAAACSGPGSPSLLHRLPSVAKAEGCLVLKFVSSRLICQSEQFASELTRHVGLACPDSRILRQQGATEAEWREAYEAAAALKDRYPDLHDEMTRNSCCLVMEFIPGQCLFKSLPALAGAGALPATAEDLGRLFTLDMLLGNADRLPCLELSWRGNPENILYASAGRWAGRAVAIDAVVQRRPPGGLMSVEDSACERLAELALNDGEWAGALLRQALQPCSNAVAAIEPRVLREAAAAFQRGLKAALQAAASIKGLLEMMFDVISDWIEEFIEDIEVASAASSSGGPPSLGGHHGGGPGAGVHVPTPRSAAASRRASSAGAAASPLLLAASAATSAQTMRIRAINHEAARNDSVGERVAHWKAYFREKGEELRAAVEEWQLKRGSAGDGAQRLTTAFLDGTHPVVDVYELKVRLEHMLQRLRVLQQATLTGRPVRLLPRLYLSGAVEASSMYLLRHLGITHVLNATEDLLLPEASQGFVTHRVPLRDVEEEDLAPHLPDASAFIDEALAAGGSVLVHCHAGKSRSCSLVLAWLMTRRRWPLNRAMEFLQRARPEAAPNAGYLAALLRLEEELFGRQTVKMKKTKPEPRTCPECGEKVGLSAESVRVHLKLKHPGCVIARADNYCSGSGSWSDLPSPTTSWGVGQLASPRSRSSGQPSPKAPSPRAQPPPNTAASAGAQLAANAQQAANTQPAANAQAAESPRRANQQQQQQQAVQQQQQQQHPAAGLWRVAAAPGSPRSVTSLPLPIPSGPALPRSALLDTGGAALVGMPSPSRVSTGPRSQAARLVADAAAAVPDSPPSMAAVLRADVGELSLSEGETEEFLKAASSGLPAAAEAAAVEAEPQERP